LKTVSYCDSFPRVEATPLSQLMLKKRATNAFITRTHHHNPALDALVFSNQLELVYAVKVRMLTLVKITIGRWDVAQSLVSSGRRRAHADFQPPSSGSNAYILPHDV
jgi:hypothetical protein